MWNEFAISQSCAKVEVACMGERGIMRPMLILEGIAPRFIAGISSSRGRASLGKPASKACFEEKKVWMSKNVALSAYTLTPRTSCFTMSVVLGCRDWRAKKRGPGRV